MWRSWAACCYAHCPVWSTTLRNLDAVLVEKVSPHVLCLVEVVEVFAKLLLVAFFVCADRIIQNRCAQTLPTSNCAAGTPA